MKKQPIKINCKRLVVSGRLIEVNSRACEKKKNNQIIRKCVAIEVSTSITVLLQYELNESKANKKEKSMGEAIEELLLDEHNSNVHNCIFIPTKEG